MVSHDVLAAFSKEHAFQADALLLEERDGIQSAVGCHDAVNRGYAALSSAVLEHDPAVGLIWQLYERCTERVYGALTAMATSCAASSEIVARAAIEASITTRYILQDRNVRLASFFQDHVHRAVKQEEQWRQTAAKADEPERTAHLAACEYRRAGVAAIKEHVNALNMALVPPTQLPSWPNIAARFQAVGEGLSYRTFYARLCAEPHFDAEETLRYVIGMMASSETFEKMAVETVMFSKFLLAEAVRTYAQTGKEFAGAYDMSAAVVTCTDAERTMREHVSRLSEHIGAQPTRAVVDGPG